MQLSHEPALPGSSGGKKFTSAQRRCCRGGDQLPQPLLAETMGRAVNPGVQDFCKTPVVGG